LKVSCIRVTHPCATRQHPLLDLLPFDLHVLGLPLAFILSQDQTLHCKFDFNPDPKIGKYCLRFVSQKEINSFGIFACFYLSSKLSKNFQYINSEELFTIVYFNNPISVEIGGAKLQIIFVFANFCEIFISFFHCLSSI